MERTLSSEFRNVDTAETADRVIGYLEFGDSLPQIRQIRVNTYEYLGLKEGDAGLVPDRGCTEPPVYRRQLRRCPDPDNTPASQ